MKTYHLCRYQGAVKEMLSCFARYTHISLKFRQFLETILARTCIYYHGLFDHYTGDLKEGQEFGSP